MRKHKIWEFKTDFLQLILDESNSLSDVCLKLNLELTKTMIKMISYRIKKDNLSLVKLNNNKIKRLHLFNTIPLNEILVENSTYIHTNNLKKKLLKYDILENKCVKCGNTGEWTGEKLILQLDHINGKSNDNRLENLRILCPNCHSQTETYSNKKKNKDEEKKIDKNTCKSCKKPSNGKVFCDKCQNYFARKRRKVDRPNKSSLLIEVNKVGYSAVGRKYGVSDNAIRNWLK